MNIYSYSLKMKTPIIGTYRMRDPVTVLSAALRLGYRHIDTAELYRNETSVKEVLDREKIPGVEVTTKVWKYSKESVRRRCDIFERIDYLLLHRPTETYLEDYENLTRQISDEELPIRKCGVSNFDSSKLDKLLEANLEVSVNQIELHPWNPQHETLEFCRQHKIPVTAHTVMGIRENLTPQQLINWAQQFSVPIIGTSNLSHLEENYRYLLNPKPVSIKPMMRHVLYPRMS